MKAEGSVANGLSPDASDVRPCACPESGKARHTRSLGPGGCPAKRTCRGNPALPSLCQTFDRELGRTAGPSAAPDFLSKTVAPVDYVRLSLRRTAYVAADRAAR
jgi:hypothetical protein